jgi:proteic killer suppression protein
VIRTFRCRYTQAMFGGKRITRFIAIEAVSMRKLAMLHQAGRLGDLKVPPGNRLEALRGSRKGQYSIRVNDQYRICFRWTDAGPEDVEIVDYH